MSGQGPNQKRTLEIILEFVLSVLKIIFVSPLDKLIELIKIVFEKVKGNFTRRQQFALVAAMILLVYSVVIQRAIQSFVIAIMAVVIIFMGFGQG